MMYHFKKSKYAVAFSLVETLTALAILAFVCASVLVVINRSMAAAANSRLQMQAMEMARENMEKLLAIDSVEQKTEYGTSDKYPDITWQTVIETFYEPISSRMWVQANCSAQYTDVEDKVQTIDFTHWLTAVSKQDMLDIIKQQEQQPKLSEEALADEDQRPQPSQEEEPADKDQQQSAAPDRGAADTRPADEQISDRRQLLEEVDFDNMTLEEILRYFNIK